MNFDTKNTKQNVAWYVKQNNEGRLNYSFSIQRHEIWNIDNKSNFIISLLFGIPVENLLFEEESSTGGLKKLKVIDGKQRVTTICRYVNNEFKLSKNIRLYEFEGDDIRGLAFDDLPENAQQILIERDIPITILKPLPDEDRAILFFMRNQAVQLSKMELSRADIGEIAMNKLEQLIKHPFIVEKINMTRPARKKYQEMQIFVEYLLLKKYDAETGFTTKEVSAMCKELGNNPEIINDSAILSILNYLDKAAARSKNLRKVVIPMLMLVAEKAIDENDMTAEKFSEWIEHGLYPLFDDEDFKATFKSMKKANVQKRLEMMMDDFSNFSKKDNVNEKSKKTPKK